MRTLILVLAALFATPVLASPEAVITREGDQWTVEYRLDRDSPVWLFSQSALTLEGRRRWRPELWSVDTPGVVLDRAGFHEVLRTEGGGPLPRDIRVRMRPANLDLEAANDPYLVYSEGSVAVSADQFDLYPFASMEAVKALPIDLNGVGIEGEATRVTWTDLAGPVLAGGQREWAPVTENYPTYVLFGSPPAASAQGLTAIIDPGLPSWIGDELKTFTPRIASHYRERLGPGASDTATVLVSWNGATPGKTSMGGSTLSGLIAATMEGEGVVTPSPGVKRWARWFLAHETAHFWMGQRIRYERSRDAWITEGSAEAMTYWGLKALDPELDQKPAYRKAADDCAALTAGKSLATAEERGDHRAYYACGHLLHLVADSAMRRKGQDGFDFLRELLEANTDGVVTRTDWLLAAREAGVPATAIADMETLIDSGADANAEIIARLLTEAGMAFRREDGRFVLL